MASCSFSERFAGPAQSSGSSVPVNDLESLRGLASHVAETQRESVLSSDVNAMGELVVAVSHQKVAEFALWLKTDSPCRFTTLVDITAVDYPSRDRRFDVVYHLLSMQRNQRIRFRTSIRESGELVPTLVPVFPAANWFEREVFDMYGVMFSGHPDLRRILTDYGFQGYPLRKDFPTTGFTEVRYDEVEKRVVQEPVSLVQEYRQFDFMSPWEGSQSIIGETAGAVGPEGSGQPNDRPDSGGNNGSAT